MGMGKAFGLAGIRLGFAIANEDIIQLMNNVKAPYNINKLTSEVAVNAMKNVNVLEKNIKILLHEREILVKDLQGLDYVVKVYPSDANFVLFRLKANANKIYKKMADGGVVARYRGSEMHCSECIRVTVGTTEDRCSFLNILNRAWNEFAS